MLWGVMLLWRVNLEKANLLWGVMLLWGVNLLGSKFALGNSIFLLVVVLIATFGTVTFFIVRFDIIGMDA
ncbi:MAG TPA: hypothetical protein P5543_11255 [Planctomycetota bacterium]|nr:hypothetical protein [Planctomycetota bacterium]HRU52754.1 hypothetical protein [Planctomycetota bacterium]